LGVPSGSIDEAYERVQRKLEAAWQAGLADAERALVALPSYSVDPTLLLHYADRLPALEQRYLYTTLLLRSPNVHIAYISCQPVPDYVVDYYLGLVPGCDADDMRKRLTLISLDDPSPRPLSLKLLERPHVIEQVRAIGSGRPAMIEPWNVTQAERDLAVAVDLPLNGAHPNLWPLCSKSSGRRLFRDAGVTVAPGEEDVRTIDDVIGAIERLRRDDPELGGAVVKLNDSASGDGNAVIDLHGLPAPGDRKEQASILRRLRAVPGWFVQALGAGRGAVEALIDGDEFRSPSVQLNVAPGGDVSVVSTHDQVLGGHSGQVYQGCRFPADDQYRAAITADAVRVTEGLATQGVLGRLSVDFVTVQRDGAWQTYALEINLRKGGTTHPMSTARLVTHGRYDEATGELVTDDGPRYYLATDNCVDEEWRTIPPTEVITRVRDAGLAYDHDRRTGVVLHMLECLPIDGRFGFTAIGDSPEHAASLYAGVEGAMRESPADASGGDR
jgi:hypothetical protein